MPVISALWEAKISDSLSQGVQDQPEQHGKTSSLQKEKREKLAGLGGRQPGQQSEALSLKKKKMHVGDCTNPLSVVLLTGQPGLQAR